MPQYDDKAASATSEAHPLSEWDECPEYEEDLPFPYVTYGPHVTFLGFSAEPDSDLVLCSCVEEPAHNLLEASLAVSEASAPLVPGFARGERLLQRFPAELVQSANGRLDSLLGGAKFVPGICHQCNRILPGRIFEPMRPRGTKALAPEHPPFDLRFGHYVNQNGWRYGLDIGHKSASVAIRFADLPNALQAAVDDYSAAEQGYWSISTEDFVTLNREDMYPVSDLRLRQSVHAHVLRQMGYRLRRYVNEETSANFGVAPPRPFVSEGEAALREAVAMLFPDDAICTNFRARWLEGLEFDVFVPSRRLAFEYQGEQHSQAVGLFGGTMGLERLKERDDKKSQLARKAGVMLVEVPYTKAVSPLLLVDLLRGVNIPVEWTPK